MKELSPTARALLEAGREAEESPNARDRARVQARLTALLGASAFGAAASQAAAMASVATGTTAATSGSAGAAAAGSATAAAGGAGVAAANLSAGAANATGAGASGLGAGAASSGAGVAATNAIGAGATGAAGAATLGSGAAVSGVAIAGAGSAAVAAGGGAAAATGWVATLGAKGVAWISAAALSAAVGTTAVVTRQSDETALEARVVAAARSGKSADKSQSAFEQAQPTSDIAAATAQPQPTAEPATQNEPNANDSPATDSNATAPNALHAPNEHDLGAIRRGATALNAAAPNPAARAAGTTALNAAVPNPAARATGATARNAIGAGGSAVARLDSLRAARDSDVGSASASASDPVERAAADDASRKREAAARSRGVASSAAAESLDTGISATGFAALATSASDARRAQPSSAPAPIATARGQAASDDDSDPELLPQPTDPDQMHAVAAAPRDDVRAPQLPATDATTPSHALNPGVTPAGVAPQAAAAASGSGSGVPPASASASEPEAAAVAGGSGAEKQAGSSQPAVALSGELQLLAQAQRALHDGKLSLALTLLDQHSSQHAQGSLREERLAARAVVLCRMHHSAAGNAEAQHLAASTPRSPLLPWVRSACTQR